METSEDTNHTSLNDILIEDVIHAILGFLDAKSLQALRLVNSTWNSLALSHLNKRVFLCVSKVNGDLFPTSFTSLGGPVCSFEPHLCVQDNSQMFLSVTNLNLNLSPPTDKSISILHKVLNSTVNLRELTLTIYEWGQIKDTPFVKSASVCQNFYAEVPPLKNLSFLEIKGTLGAYSVYLCAGLIKAANKLKCLSLPHLVRNSNEIISDRNNSRLWLYNWLSSHPEVTSKLEVFTWSPFNLSFEGEMDNSVLTVRNAYLKKFSSVKSLQFGSKLRKLKWNVLFGNFEKSSSRFEVLAGVIPKSIERLNIEGFAYCSELADENSSDYLMLSPANVDDVNTNGFVIFSSSMNYLTHIELDVDAYHSISLVNILSLSPNLVSLVINDTKCKDQFLVQSGRAKLESELSKLFGDQIIPCKNIRVLKVPFCVRSISELIKLHCKFPNLTSLSFAVEEGRADVNNANCDKFHLLNIVSNCKIFSKLIWLEVNFECNCNEKKSCQIKFEMNCSNGKSNSGFPPLNISCKSVYVLVGESALINVINCKI